MNGQTKWYAFLGFVGVKISPKEVAPKLPGRVVKNVTQQNYCCLTALKPSRRWASFLSAWALGASGFKAR